MSSIERGDEPSATGLTSPPRRATSMACVQIGVAFGLMKEGRVSQTALKVALGLITLSIKDDWAERLPEGLVELSERLLLASGVTGYGPGTIRASKKKWMIRLYDLQDLMMPGQFEGFGHRKIWMNEQVEAAIAAGARQALIVGAGFDTLTLRLAPKHPDVKFFEVDHPATSAAKAKGLAEVGQPANLFQIAEDLGERALAKVLEEDARFDISVPTVFVAEGLFQYLTDEEVRSTLKDAAQSAPSGSRFAFSHAIPGYNKWVDFLTRLISESWKSSVASEDIPEYVDGTGWRVLSEPDNDTAHGVERYALAERV